MKYFIGVDQALGMPIIHLWKLCQVMVLKISNPFILSHKKDLLKKKDAIIYTKER